MKKRRRVKRGDQYRFECKGRSGGEGVFAYAVVLRKETGCIPIIATFPQEVTEEELSDPRFLEGAYYLGGAESEPMSSGEWEWVKTLQIGEQILLPKNVLVDRDITSGRPTYAIDDPNTEAVVEHCSPDQVRGLKPSILYANDASIRFQTLCVFHGIQYEPTVDDYEAFDGHPFNCVKPIFDRAHEQIREIYGVEAVEDPLRGDVDCPLVGREGIEAAHINTVVEGSSGPYVVMLTVQLQTGLMGGREERDSLLELEDRILLALKVANLGSFEGNGFGLGVYNLSIVCKEARAVVEVLEGVVRPSEFTEGSYVSVSSLADEEVSGKVLFNPRGV